MVNNVVFGPEESAAIVDRISQMSVEFSGEEIPAFARGYMSSLLKSLSEVSPEARQELVSIAHHAVQNRVEH